MKKSFVLLLTLVLLISGTAYYAQGEILKEKDQVHYTETVLYGDKSVVDGVTVDVKLGYDYHLYWNTTYEIGQNPKEQTEYNFYPWYHQNYDGRYVGSLSFMLNSRDISVDNIQFESGKEFTGMSAAFYELYKKTEPGESKVEVIHLKDYVEYYEFDLDLSLPRETNAPVMYTYDYYNAQEIKEAIEKLEESGKNEEQLKGYQECLRILEEFHTFFKIPVLETELSAIGLAKDKNGAVTGWAVSNAYGGSSSGNMGFIERPELQVADVFDFYIMNIYDNGTCYFTFDPYTRDEKLVDVSLIPGGYGIFSFEYDVETARIDAESLHTEYVWNPEERIVDMRLDASGKNILLFTQDASKYRLNIIAKDTMTLVDTYEIGSKDCYLSSWVYEDFLVVVGENLIVFEIEEKGQYTQVLSLNKENLQKNIPENEYELNFLTWSCCFDWNGETLVMTNRMYRKDEYRGMNTSNFCVAAVDKTGLLYCGRYDSSLDTRDTMYAGCYINVDEENPIQIHWK